MLRAFSQPPAVGNYSTRQPTDCYAIDNPGRALTEHGSLYISDPSELARTPPWQGDPFGLPLRALNGSSKPRSILPFQAYSHSKWSFEACLLTVR